MGNRTVKIRGTGSVAKMLGLSDEGVRLYEKYGVIKPKKDPITGYRKFDIMDFVSFMSLRAFRQCGFGLQEIATFANKNDYPEIRDSFLFKIEELEELKKYQDRLILRMKEMSNLITDIDAHLWKCSIATRPAMFRFEFIVESGMSNEDEIEDLISQWTNYSPFAVLSTRYYGDELPPPSLGESVSGLGILERDADLFGVKENEFVSYCPEKTCVYSIVRSDNSMLEADFTHIKDFMRKSGLVRDGDPIARSIINTHQNKEFNRYLQMWVPVKDAQ